MKSIIRNFIYVLRRFKTATILNILGLSVAFASFMVIMMQVNYHLNFDKNIKDAENIYRVDRTNIGDGYKHAILSNPLADYFFNSSPHILAGTIQEAFQFSRYLQVVDKDNNQSGIIGSIQRVEKNYTDVFHFDMIEGSGKALNEPRNILIPQSLAQKLFGNESALNKQLDMEDLGIAIIGGVYKDFPSNCSLSNIVYMDIPDEWHRGHWGNSNYYAFVKMDSRAVVEDVMKSFDKRITSEFTDEKKDIRLELIQLPQMYYTTGALYDGFPKSSKQTLAILIAIAFVIIIIAAVNFTNFSMALAPARIRSINTRKVMGATNRELHIALISEAVSTSMISFIISFGLLKLLQFTFVTEAIIIQLSSSDVPLILMSALIALLIGFISGIYPAYYITSFSPAMVLKGSFGLPRKVKKTRSLLIGFQFVSSLVLIMSASFMYLQNHFMENSPLGYNKEELIVIKANNKLMEKWDILKSELKSYPEIKDITRSNILLSSDDQYRGWGRLYKDKNVNFQCLPVAASFLDVIGIELTDGRNFRESDEYSKSGVLICNEKARATYDFELNTYMDSTEIIGFVTDIKFASFRTEIEPMAFYVGEMFADEMKFIYIKTNKGSSYHAAMDRIQNTLNTIDPGYPFNVFFFDKVFDNTYRKEKQMSSFIALFSLIAILISIVGVCGLVIFETEYRRKEISIRKVMGSSIIQVLKLLNKVYIKMLLITFAIAIPITYYLIRSWLENFAYKTPMYWWVFAAGGIIILLFVIGTVTWQSWKAAITNPVDSLKNE